MTVVRNLSTVRFPSRICDYRIANWCVVPVVEQSVQVLVVLEKYLGWVEPSSDS